MLVTDGPQRVRDLADWGAGFDSDRDGVLVGREAAHSRNRIVHAGGDATGREVEAALVRRLRHVRRDGDRERPRDLAARSTTRAGAPGSSCATAMEPAHARVLGAGAVILASGGAGQLWRNTTNPAAATGDGVALAWDAGAEVASMEFMQFHPTALALDGAPRFLISEAMRGEGAHVVDAAGERFLFDADPRGELAGRDVVSQAIWNRLLRDGADHVYLDCRPLGAAVRESLPDHHGDLPGARHRHHRGADPDRAGGALHDRRRAHRRRRRHLSARAVRLRRGGQHRRARRQPAGQQQPSRGGGLRPPRRRRRAPRHRRAPRCTAAAPRRRASPPPGQTSGEGTAAGARLRDAMWEGCGLVRDAAGLRAGARRS